jgi:hypothetical protein
VPAEENVDLSPIHTKTNLIHPRKSPSPHKTVSSAPSRANGLIGEPSINSLSGKFPTSAGHFNSAAGTQASSSARQWSNTDPQLGVKSSYFN